MINKMKPEINKVKAIAAGSTLLLVCAICGIVFLNQSKNKLGGLLDSSKLTSEKLLSEKLALDKEIAKLKTDYLYLEGQNAETDKILLGLKEKLAAKEKAIKSNKWNDSKLKQIQKELVAVKNMRAQLEKDLAAQSSLVKELRDQNASLTNSIASLEAKNKYINDQNALLSTIAASNYSVNATRGKKDKITVLANKTKKLKLGIDVPESEVENIQFTIRTPEGKVIHEGKSLAVELINNTEETLYASLQLFPNSQETLKRVAMTYKPTEKMKKGLYHIDITSKGKIVGSCQVKLR